MNISAQFGVQQKAFQDVNVSGSSNKGEGKSKGKGAGKADKGSSDECRGKGKSKKGEGKVYTPVVQHPWNKRRDNDNDDGNWNQKQQYRQLLTCNVKIIHSGIATSLQATPGVDGNKAVVIIHSSNFNQLNLILGLIFRFQLTL